MNRIQNICAHISSRSPQVTKQFLQEVLNFIVAFEYSCYIELEKDGLLLGIQQSEGEPNQQSLYTRMEGIDEFWASQKESLSQYEAGEPFIQEYGMKEIHVIAPETNTPLFIGERVNA